MKKIYLIRSFLSIVYVGCVGSVKNWKFMDMMLCVYVFRILCFILIVFCVKKLEGK